MVCCLMRRAPPPARSAAIPISPGSRPKPTFQHSPTFSVAASPNDSATGAGTSLGSGPIGDFLHFTVSAHSGASGEDPRGNIVYRFLDPNDEGVWPGGKPRSADIICVLVDGNTAAVVAEFKKGDRPFGNGYPFLGLLVEDNGQPSDATPDRALATGFSGVTCEEFRAAATPHLQPLVSGNVRVDDAP